MIESIEPKVYFVFKLLFISNVQEAIAKLVKNKEKYAYFITKSKLFLNQSKSIKFVKNQFKSSKLLGSKLLDAAENMKLFVLYELVCKPWALITLKH